MKRRNWIAVLAALLCMSTLLSACGKDPTGTNPTSIPTTAPRPTEERPTTPYTEPVVAPTVPSVTPTEPPVAPTEPPVAPTEPPVAPTEPPVAPTEPTVHTHEWSDWIISKEATCTESGTRQRTCSCGEISEEITAPYSHEEVTDAAVPATCTESGLTEGKHCSRCGAVIMEQKTTSPTGHNFGDWKTNEPTCTKDGKKFRSCHCGKVETEVLPATGHSFSVWKITDPACTEDGRKTRSCHCGEAETVILPATGHQYVDDVCSCGHQLYAGVLAIADNIPLTSFFWTNGDVIVGQYEDQSYMYSTDGTLLAGPFDYMTCPNYDGYLVAGTRVIEEVERKYDEDFGTEIVVEKCTNHGYVLDTKGNIIFEKVGIWLDDVWSRTYEGEFVEYTNDGRIITLSYSTYYLGMARNDCTINLYDMRGNKVGTIEEVYIFSNIIDGKIIYTNWNYVGIADQNGNLLADATQIIDQYFSLSDDYWFFAEGIGEGHHKGYFANGYAMIDYNFAVMLLHEEAKHAYLLNSDYLYSLENYGTLVFSKVTEGDILSQYYYLIDLSKCAVDEKGRVIPTIDATLNKTPLSSGHFDNYFGRINSLILIESVDGKWGYMNYKGEILALYDDATTFVGGYAMIKDGDSFYVINESLQRVSNALTGYDSVSLSGEGVFILRKDDVPTVVIFTP